jgi:transposase
VCAFRVGGVVDQEGEEARSAMEWAQVRSLAADGVSKRQIAARLGINRRTVDRLVAAAALPRYARAPKGSMLDPLEPVLRGLLEERPEMKAPRVTEILRASCGYEGSLDLVKKRLAALRPGRARPAQRTGYWPRQVLQLDWAEMPTRPKVAGRQRRVYALIASLPFSGAQTAHLASIWRRSRFWRATSARLSGWAAFRASASMTTCARSSRAATATRSPGIRGSWRCAATMPLTRRLARRRRREKGSFRGAVRRLKTGFWPARRIARLVDLDEQYAHWRDRVCNRRRHATGGFWVRERLEVERDALRSLSPSAFDYAGRRATRVPLDGYLKLGGCFYRAPEPLVHQRVELRFDRDRVWVAHRGQIVARYPRSHDRGRWFPPARLRPEPPLPTLGVALAGPVIPAPELTGYAELCA